MYLGQINAAWFSFVDIVLTLSVDCVVCIRHCSEGQAGEGFFFSLLLPMFKSK